VLAELAELGIDLGEVTAKLEEEGVAAFASAFDDLIDTLTAKAGSTGAASGVQA
jgi:transaldolase